MAEVTGERVPLSTLADQPVYNIKAVCKRTGLTMATLRAWERRHKVPLPNRTQQGYRLYSERDIATLFWLLEQMDHGLNIGHAARQLHALLNVSEEIWVRIPPHVSSWSGIDYDEPRSPDVLRNELIDSLTQLDERAADSIFTESAALYTAETMLINIMQSALHGLNDHYQQGNLPGATMHFAINAARRRLQNMIQMTPVSRMLPTVVLIGFSDERNEIDILILNLLLRRHGWSVSYLGNDLDPKMIGPALAEMNAGLIVFYTDIPHNAEKLVGFSVPVDSAGRTLRAAYCGHALDTDSALSQKLGLEYLGVELRQITHRIIQLMSDFASSKVSDPAF